MSFNFKKLTKLYVEYENALYNIDISDINFSQTFTENSFPVKTLHNQTFNFEGSVINKANPVNFSFDTYLIKENDYNILFSLISDYTNDYNIKNFNIYIDTQKEMFKITNAAISEATVSISKTEALGLSIEGEASKLELISSGFVLPNIVPKSTNRNILIAKKLLISSGTDVFDKGVYKCNISIQNKIDWVDYATLQGAFFAVDANTSMYPENYVLESRVLSGSFGQYVEDNTENMQQWSTSAPLLIKVGEQQGSDFYGLELDIPECSVTNRLRVDSIYTQEYDWRMVSNPLSLNTVFKPLTLALTGE